MLYKKIFCVSSTSYNTFTPPSPISGKLQYLPVPSLHTSTNFVCQKYFKQQFDYLSFSLFHDVIKRCQAPVSKYWELVFNQGRHNARKCKHASKLCHWIMKLFQYLTIAKETLLSGRVVKWNYMASGCFHLLLLLADTINQNLKNPSNLGEKTLSTPLPFASMSACHTPEKTVIAVSSTSNELMALFMFVY